MKDAITDKLNKKTALVAFVGLAMLTGGSAAILSFFGTVTGDASVQQAVTLDGDSSYSFTSDGVAGDLYVSEERNLSNNQDETLPVTISSDIDDTDQDSFTGANVSHLTYLQYNVDGDGYGMDVSVVNEPLEGDSEYAVRVEGDSTKDYATVTYANDSITKDSVIKFDLDIHDETTHEGLVGSDGTAGTSDDYDMDEVYLYHENGTTYGITSDNDGTTDTVDLDNADYYDSEPSDFSKIVGIGFGFGDASNLIEGGSDLETSVNVTLDNVRIDGTNVDEKFDHSKTLLSTDASDEDYGITSVVDTATTLEEDSLSINTTVAP